MCFTCTFIFVQIKYTLVFSLARKTRLETEANGNIESASFPFISELVSTKLSHVTFRATASIHISEKM